MELTSFDIGYVERLTSGDPGAVDHFTRYFSELIYLKLRAQRFSNDQIEDIRQETFARVFAALKREQVRQPERLGAFVNSLLSNVTLEHLRSRGRLEQMDEESVAESMADEREGQQEKGDWETKALIEDVLGGMSQKHQQILKAVYFENSEATEICRQFGIDRNYLRVLLFRARQEFRRRYASVEHPKTDSQH